MIFFNNRWELYELINKMEKGRLSLIRFNMGWSERKTIKYLKKLIKDGLVKEKDGIFFPTPWQDLINWDEMSMKREDFK